MKPFLVFSVTLLVLTLLIPLLIPTPNAIRNELPSDSDAMAVFSLINTTAESEEETVSVYFPDTKETRQMLLEEYLVGVVCAEMPAGFQVEALKAQAVAARTYSLYKKEIRGGKRDEESPHPDADVCTDYTHCKAYKSEKDSLEGWGGQGETYLKKIQDAVNDTSGQVLVYEKHLINAVFHAISSGKTENCSDIWGGQLPYLVSVDSPGETEAPNYHTTVSVPEDEFSSILSAAGATVDPEARSSWIGEALRSSAGSILKLSLCGQEFTGSEVRSLFSLRSQNFQIEDLGESIVFHVTGYGHGVGMSQYGANSMALSGSTWEEIVTHYYSGSSILPYEKISKQA